MAQARGKSLRQGRGLLTQIERFLIYTEGAVSESIYLKGLRADLGRRGPSIELGRVHGEPFGLVKAAIEHQARQQREGDGFDEVWCVFDVECPAPHSSIDEAVRLAQENGIKCGITNPCFELWLVLHFTDHHGWLTTDQACERLMSLPCGYDRRGKSFNYAECRGNQEVAASRATALAAKFDEMAPLRTRNPWTSVHMLLNDLKRPRAA